MSDTPHTRHRRFARTRLERDVSAVTGLAMLGAACGAALLTLAGVVVFGISALPQGGLDADDTVRVNADGAARAAIDGRRTGNAQRGNFWQRHWPSWMANDHAPTGRAIGDDVLLHALLTRSWNSAAGDAAQRLHCAGPPLLQALDGAHYGWSACAEVDAPTPTLVKISEPIVVHASTALMQLARQLGGEVLLVNLHGAAVERADDGVPLVSDDAATSPSRGAATALQGNRGRRFERAHDDGWPPDAQWPVLSRDTAAVQRLRIDGRHYWQTAVPLAGADTRQIAWLVWRTSGSALASTVRDAASATRVSTASLPAFPARAQRGTSPEPGAARAPVDTHRSDYADVLSRLGRLALIVVPIVALALLCIAALRWSFSVIFAPLRRAMSDLRRLADGHIVFQPDDADQDRDDEAGAIVRAAMTLRADVLARRAARDERARSAARQGQLMREQLRTLAVTLDEADRIRIGQTLDALQAPSDSLIDLAGVLTHMTRLVCGQHERLRGLLVEREAALVREVQFAALHQELLIARQMQMSILPQALPSACDAVGLALASTILPAREVGGDFYDYFMLDARHLAIVVADVSGKGVPAAFFMAVARALLKNTAGMVQGPAAVMTRLNALLCEDNAQCMFVTMFFGVLDLQTATFDYVNAGHNCPLRLKRSAPGIAGWIDQARGIALGVLPEARYTQHREMLDRDDIVFFYTDGVTEACDRDDALFGDGALRETVMAAVAAMEDEAADAVPTTPVEQWHAVPHAVAGSRRAGAATARRVTDAVMTAVHVFADGAPQADDITCVALAWDDVAALHGGQLVHAGEGDGTDNVSTQGWASVSTEVEKGTP